jgi:hypothetical protein
LLLNKWNHIQDFQLDGSPNLALALANRIIFGTIFGL